jgi:hypothetical protein
VTPAQLLAHLGYPHDPQAEAAIDRLARQRAAAELRAVAEGIPHRNLDWMGKVQDALIARAVSLTSDGQPPA